MLDLAITTSVKALAQIVIVAYAISAQEMSKRRFLHGQNVSYLSLLSLLVDRTGTCSSRFVLFLRASEGCGFRDRKSIQPGKDRYFSKATTIYKGIRDSQNML